MIQTTKGLMPNEALRIVDTPTMEDNARVMATEYFDGDELVRRDVWVSMLRGASTEVQGNL